MSFIKRNIWVVGFAVLLVGAIFAMWASGRNSAIPPTAPIVQENADISVNENDHIKGSPNGVITLVEFSDFQCPACKAYAPILSELSRQFPDDLRIVYKHFPLRSIHPGAEPAARASEAAALQGRFWDMHDILFENQDAWGRAPSRNLFEKYAGDIGLDTEQFKRDYDSSIVRDKVTADSALSAELGLNSTPSFYLNGRKINNPLSVEEFADLIRAELAVTQGPGPQ